MCQLWTQSSSSNSSAYRDEPLGPFSEEPGSGLSKGRKISEAHSEGLAWRARGAGRGGTDGRRCGSPGSPSPLGPRQQHGLAHLPPKRSVFLSSALSRACQELGTLKNSPDSNNAYHTHTHTHTHTQLNISSPIYAAKEGLVK